MTEIDSADVSNMVDSTSADLLNEINEKNKIPRIGPWALGAALILLGLGNAASINPVLLFILALSMAAGVYFAFQRDTLRRTVVLLYDFDPALEKSYADLHVAAHELSMCESCWHVTATGTIENQKYNSGVSRIVSRQNTSIRSCSPSFLKTNIPTVAISAGRQTIHLFPDRVLVVDGNRIGAIGYDEFAVEVSQERMIETSPPRDATIVDRTWRHVNKNGEPDRRFRDNPQLPICQYDCLHFKSHSGLNELIQISRSGVGQQFADAVRALAPPVCPQESGPKEVKHQERAIQSEQSPRSQPILSPMDFSNYELPGFDLLNAMEESDVPELNRDELLNTQRIIIEALRSFGIVTTPGDITRGPAITRYELHPSTGLNVSRITQVEADIARATRTKQIHIVERIPGKNTVGIEIENTSKQPVTLGELLLHPEFRSAKIRIPLALGRDSCGNAVIGDLAAMPHLLIGGATGSGKSVCIHSMIASMLFKFGPDELRFIMIDPSVVEMQAYNRLPHLIVPVATDPIKCVAALKWAVFEMERRHQILARIGVQNIDDFNKRPRLEIKDVPVTPADFEIGEDTLPDRFPYIVVLIDGLTDLMQIAQAEVEQCILQIAENSSATGIHLVIASQTAAAAQTIKTYIPSRIAFRMASKADSQIILDGDGAEKLCGNGDMLYLPPGLENLQRVQGAIISDAEIERIIDHCAAQGSRIFETNIRASINSDNTDDSEEVFEVDEELIHKCIEVVRQEQKASTSLLQRRLRLGYTRAERIVDILEERGIIGPADGINPREVYLRP